jgi:hypothetical protein
MVTRKAPENSRALYPFYLQAGRRARRIKDDLEVLKEPMSAQNGRY